ncbi:M20/M25/M40 family metallo-hydrolase [Lysinibacillus sp. CD3-6]|uniref:M20/M25/M40 family metallo-hydrolase n=1 Tax=Lysinibacillus sp. CD3-6 TaxID=2892541 RepID=UPI00116D9FD0|nr:M20/M25/M40 family metallo-hydrolase [Lysinibacillus sp. CD3-6]UED80886.1 M20/M25/M40 family metallo-hydrolase [Lysinibacillus sp. CD3-6]
MLKTYDEVLKVTNDLVNIESIVNTEGEIDISTTLAKTIANLPYFQKHSDYVFTSQTVDDEIERYNVFAFVRGTKESSAKTVVLMGHTDTVGIDDYNSLKEKACFPNNLQEALKNEKLPPLVKEHLESNEWLFGRGTLDMKSGVASNFYLLKYYSEHPEELKGNIVFFAECDEEDSSHGVLSGLNDLKQLRDEYGFEYEALINSDFVAPRYEGDENRYIYKGSVGKLLPSFYITGAESHVGSSFEGLDPNYIAAELTRQIAYNPELCDKSLGETPMPPVTLKQTDFKETYTVQTALASYVYYNFFVQSWSPKDVLDKLKNQAEIAFNNVVENLNNHYKRYCEISEQEYTKLPWETRVLFYEELEQSIISQAGESYKEHMKKFKENLLANKELDVRMFSARVVEETWKWAKDKSPAIILFYSSLYSPRVEVTGKNQKEKNLLIALDYAIEKVQPHYNKPIVQRNYFPYICDMSCVAINDDEDSIQSVINNNPSWGTKHFVDYKAIRDINIPAINIGPYGYDAHNRYERTELKYTMEIMPNLTKLVIDKLLGS